MADTMNVECAADMPSSFCDPLRVATRAQDPSRCPDEPSEARPLCEALASSDPDRCAGDSDCRELAGRLRLLASGGLPRVAPEDSRAIE